MKPSYIVWIIIICTICFPLRGEPVSVGNKELPDFLGRIGFLQEINLKKPDQVNGVEIGIEVTGNILYKLTSDEGGINVSAGMLSPGINTIPIPIDLIVNENKGVFYLHLKNGNSITIRQIVLVTDRYEIFGKTAGDESGETLNNDHTHEVIVSGMNDSGVDMHNRIVWDSVTGDFPGLTQGISVLPILYLLGSEIYHSLKKRKKRVFPLYSQTEVSTDHGQKKGQYARLSLGIHITD